MATQLTGDVTLGYAASMRLVLTAFLCSGVLCCGCRDQAKDDATRASLTQRLALAQEQATKKDAAFVAAMGAIGSVSGSANPCPIELPVPRTSNRGGSFDTMAGAVEAGRAAVFLLKRFAIADAAALAGLHSRAFAATQTELRSAETAVQEPRPEWRKASELVDRATSLDWGVELVVVPNIHLPALAIGAGAKTAGRIKGRAFLFDHGQGRIVCVADVDASGPTSTVFSVPVMNGVPVGSMEQGTLAAGEDLKAAVLKDVAARLKARN